MLPKRSSYSAQERAAVSARVASRSSGGDSALADPPQESTQRMVSIVREMSALTRTLPSSADCMRWFSSSGAGSLGELFELARPHTVSVGVEALNDLPLACEHSTTVAHLVVWAIAGMSGRQGTLNGRFTPIGNQVSIEESEYHELVRQATDAFDKKARSKQPRVKEEVVRERGLLNKRSSPRTSRSSSTSLLRPNDRI